MGPEEAGHIETRQSSDVKEQLPPQYRVDLLNDDYTPMEFVVFIISEVFNKLPAESYHLMLMVHTVGKATIGIYAYDIAITKAQKVKQISRENGFPLRCLVEEE